MIGWLLCYVKYLTHLQEWNLSQKLLALSLFCPRSWALAIRTLIRSGKWSDITLRFSICSKSSLFLYLYLCVSAIRERKYAQNFEAMIGLIVRASALSCPIWQGPMSKDFAFVSPPPCEPLALHLVRLSSETLDWCAHVSHC